MERYVLAIGGNIVKHPDGGWVKYEEVAWLQEALNQEGEAVAIELEKNKRLREAVAELTKSATGAYNPKRVNVSKAAYMNLKKALKEGGE